MELLIKKFNKHVKRCNRKKEKLKNNFDKNILKCIQCELMFNNFESFNMHFYQIHNNKELSKDNEEKNEKENQYYKNNIIEGLDQEGIKLNEIENKEDLKKNEFLMKKRFKNIKELEELKKEEDLKIQEEFFQNNQNNYYKCYRDGKQFETEREYI